MLKQIKQNFSYLFASELVVRTLTLIFTIYLARLYGPEEFGIYSLALSIGGLFDIVFNMGLATIFMQRVAAHPQKMQEQLKIFLPLRLLLSLGLLVSFSIFAFILQKEMPTVLALLVTGVYFSLSSLSIFLWACFDARQRMGFTAVLKLLMYAIAAAAGMLFIFQEAPMYIILSAYIIGALITTIATLLVVHTKFTPIALSWNPPEWKKIIVAGWPIALSGTFVFVYTSLDTILISLNKGEYFVGQYQMGYKIIGTLFILATIINQAYFPSLIENVQKSKDKLQEIFRSNMQSVFFWSIPITIGGLMLADRIILFIFGEEYMPGAPAFKILIWNTVIFFASSALINILYANKKQRDVMNVFFLGAVANVVLNLLVIPVYGIEGAALTTIAAELMVLIGMYLKARNKVRIPFLSVIVKPVIAVAIMVLALSMIFLESLILTVGIGALVYFGTYFALTQIERWKTTPDTDEPPMLPKNLP